MSYIDNDGERNRVWNWAFVGINSMIGVCETYLKSGMVGSDSKNLAVAAHARLGSLIQWLDKA